MTTTVQIKPATKRARKMARVPQGSAPTEPQPVALAGPAPATALQTAPDPVAKPQSKAALVLDLLRRDSGATLEQRVAAPGWWTVAQRHEAQSTVRFTLDFADL